MQTQRPWEVGSGGREAPHVGPRDPLGITSASDPGDRDLGQEARTQAFRMDTHPVELGFSLATAQQGDPRSGSGPPTGCPRQAPHAQVRRLLAGARAPLSQFPRRFFLPP